jgi:hypothetical protein
VRLRTSGLFAFRVEHAPALRPPDEDRLQQRTRSIPHDLYADTDENERRQAKDNIHCSLSYNAPDWLGKAIHQVDAARYEYASQERCYGQNRASPPSAWLAPTAIATEIEPGPTVSGIVSG